MTTRTFEGLRGHPITVDHTHQGRVSLEYVINEWDRNYYTGGGCSEREARKTLDKRGKKRRGEMPGKKKNQSAILETSYQSLGTYTQNRCN